MDFLPSLTTIAVFTLAGLLLALTPGPDMTLFLGRTLARGRSAGLAALLGTATGCLVHTTMAVAGVSALLAASQTGFLILKIVGALYLAWLAWQAVFRGSTFRLGGERRGSASFAPNYAAGLGVNILNPKVVLFFMTFLPQFVSAGDPAAWQKMLFLGVYFVVFSTPLMAVMILTADRFAHALQGNPKVSRTIDYLFGSVFAVFAVKILMTEGR